MLIAASFIMEWDWLNDQLRHLLNLLYSTPMGEFMRTSTWAWPTFESLHFIGMSLPAGTIVVFDLRLLGFARAVPASALHRLIPFGGGFLLNMTTGICFICATPDQYLFNAAFRWKVVFVVIAGLNVLFFYTRVFRRLEAVSENVPPPLAARVVGGISLGAWIGVMSARRLLTFFRP
jgi:predicted benzoate:H+ symporter BenE